MPNGQDILAIARAHVGEKYVLGARVPKDNATWKGPWDCAEFASWCLFQVNGQLFGCDQTKNPGTADAYTGYWQKDAKRAKAQVPLAVAKVTKGAFVLRFPAPGLIGHIAISDGQGGTVEAHSSAKGVIASRVDGRRWDTGVLPPMIDYEATGAPQLFEPAGLVLRLKTPPMKGKLVSQLQQSLAAKGFMPGEVDGSYGPFTAAAVHAFQLVNGLVVDGEAGAATLKALGIDLAGG